MRTDFMRIAASLPVISAAIVLFAACTHTAGGSAPSAAVQSRRSAIVPLVDHHQHLLGPTALPPPEPSLPVVQVPAELSRLLEERARISANVKSAADLAGAFTDDAMVLTWKRPSRWVSGEAALIESVNAVFPYPFRYEPHAWALDDTSGFVAGAIAVTVPDRAEPVRAIDFLFGVKKSADGLWRIAAESTTVKTAPLYGSPITAEKLVADLDEAEIRRAIVLSNAYWMGGRFADPADELTREYDAVRAENDWVAEQVGRYPDRLVMACSAHVLKAYAIQELERCTKIPQSKAFKLHVADANVSLDKPEHVDKLRRFFKAANDLRVPIVVHLAPRTFYGPKEVELLLSQVISQAPDIVVQIAHLAGDGPGITSPEALEAFANARTAGDPRTNNLYFDFAGLITAKTDPKQAELMATRMRQLGLQRVLYASDGAPPNAATGEHWTQTRRKLPLTDEELRIVAGNVAPYMK
ncbi:MAG TPA: amidohydrolase family protein [Thermoanaerobaculia bacterium]|nr:amidohydrolase family protein [Thermoanaerobaculia bacterium]